MAWNYSRAVEYADAKAVSMPGTERINALMRALGDPQSRLLRVHVAGTNGKGSVSAYIAAAIGAAGYRTGRFSSPAVRERRECFCIDGEFIGESEYAYCMERVAKAAESLKEKGLSRPTSFEAETAAAYLWFVLKGCRVAVVEAGMGGKDDATNVSGQKTLLALTSIALDHTAFLGGTIEEIARAKAGMLTPGCAVVALRQERACEEAITRTAKEAGCDCEFVEPLEFLAFRGDRQLARLGGTRVSLMPGTRQLGNAAVAAAAIKKLNERGLYISESAIVRGFESVALPGRQERIGRLILDGAHNPDAAGELGRSLDLYYPEKKKVALIGVFADKDHAGVLKALLPHVDAAVTFDWENRRALKGSLLADEARGSVYCEYVPEIEGALGRALELAGEDGLVVACGSFSHLEKIRCAYCAKEER